mmetsp:Transcript_164087/g.521798  ORF Transcript_164087/g.521798 Transcript_164087/m.521798 type:complete len:204 (-) Transcript_164087:264-875(-)|eukprot:CAMPEP_0204116458 /NCGR_PEP_ID=MMETSP0361-20130328/5418_1 /ASSEMBLY_ACC=CAM_ASM_000343 /TAXON_ID=268821 /ORGANISM="Scrippsiella Hangoei, Strain SHTV-5" /LENGTH=203 /DNA_ID=CAMNT_0051067253 /DNA_START=145 /DNA_END=756 /DNA_ORIENTATION=+
MSSAQLVRAFVAVLAFASCTATVANSIPADAQSKVGESAHTAATSTPCAHMTITPIFASVTRVAPECFIACPEMCKPVSEMLDGFLGNVGTDRLMRMVCAAEEQMSCMYKGGDKPVCEKLLAAVPPSMKIPKSAQELREQCINSTGNATTTTTTGAAHDMPSTSTTRLPTSASRGLDLGRSQRLVWTCSAALLVSSVLHEYML